MIITKILLMSYIGNSSRDNNNKDISNSNKDMSNV
jgi:hypothetical protein